MTQRLLAISLALLIGIAPTLGFAAQKGDQKALRAALGLFKQGSMALQAKDFDAALKLFRKAQATYEHEPLIILALAKTLDSAGEMKKALRYYEIFIRQVNPTDPERKPTLERIQVLRKKLAAQPAVLVLKGLPTGALVKLDGKTVQVGAANQLIVQPGVHRIKVSMGSRIPYAREGIPLAAGQKLALDVVLLDPVDRSKLSRDHTWTWVAGGLTAAAALGLGIVAVRSASLNNEYGEIANLETGQITAAARKKYGCDSQVASDCPKLISEAKKRKQAIDDNNSLLYITGIATGALAIATFGAFFAAPIKKPADQTAWQLLPSFDGRRPGVAFSLRF